MDPARSPDDKGGADAALLKKQRARSGTALHLKDRGEGVFDHPRAQAFPRIPMPPKSSAAAS